MQEATSTQANHVETGMEVYGADGQRLGTVERIGDGEFFAAGRRLANDAVQRVEDGHVHLFGESGTYTGEETADEQAQQSQRLPNTEEPLFLNEREVATSMEDRLPTDRQR
jgi:hypothetical protein